MKKHDEGYALPFVLVVSIVMSLIAITVMGFAQDNLSAQQASVGRMQAKYEAAGIIEEIASAIPNPSVQEGTVLSVFEENEERTFSYDPAAGILRIAACGTYGEGEKIYLIAGLKISGTDGISLTGESETWTLTVSAPGTAEYVLYDVVDQEAACAFVGRNFPVAEETGEGAP